MCVHVAAANLGSGLLLGPADISINRGPDGRKLALGEGGFGSVYKGEVLPEGLEVAIKVVKVGMCCDNEHGEHQAKYQLN